MPLLLVRHASAGDRADWPGDDRVRPLDRRGREQVTRLVELLEPYRVDAILTSPYLRCVDTVVPLAAARGLQADVREELSEELQFSEGVELVRTLAGRDVVVCGHGGLDSVLPDAPKWKKGSVFVVGERLELLDTFRA